MFPSLLPVPKGEADMDDLGSPLARLRAAPPLVHCITNFVAMNVMANVLLAVGASPAMVHAREEVAEFAGLASALAVNIGTLDPSWVDAMETAARTMAAAGKPWVLDPVGVGATALRRDAGRRLVELRPTVIRGNASEILALAGLTGAARGVDAGDTVEAAIAAARELANRTGGVVAVSGAADYVTDGSRGYRLPHGDPMMTRVTALGCSLNGVIAAYAAGAPALAATVSALAHFGLAGERAIRQSHGPGSFQPAFLDALAALTPDELARDAKVVAA